MRSAALGGGQGGRRRIRAAASELLDFTGQFAAHPNQRLDQLGARAFGGWGAEDGFHVLETGVPAQRDVAKAEYREQADACLYAASTEYSEHRRIVVTAG